MTSIYIRPGDNRLVRRPSEPLKIGSYKEKHFGQREGGLELHGRKRKDGDTKCFQKASFFFLLLLSSGFKERVSKINTEKELGEGKRWSEAALATPEEEHFCHLGKSTETRIL